ncbi:MAG: hypothetical protein COS88_06225 [Chloroflexi bacterium CG07_land_8_20_14_0_80_51_10]|nr:MAG: hypothetical protein COS88_06225 [Chloroflexi bacterium CG07_land_8_20_14_0_80_51_10]
MNNNLVLIDTSVWILALRKSFMPLAKEKVEYLLDREEAAITPMVCLELLGGVRSERVPQKLTFSKKVSFYLYRALPT